MAEIQEQELVTKGLLLAFGTKCKRMFKLNPVHALNHSNARWIVIGTSLKYNDLLEGFDDLYINLLGVTVDKTLQETTFEENQVIDSNFYVRANSNQVIYSAQGINLGTETIEAMVIAKGSDDKVNIYLHLPVNREVRDIIIDVVACLGDNLLFSVVESIDFISTLSTPAAYEQISTSSSTLPFVKDPIGDIVVQLQLETQFTIIEDQNGLLTVEKSYPEDSIFSKIFEATQADKLSHGLIFQYDWENPIDSTDSPVTITNGELVQGTVVKIPIPDLLKNGTSTEGDSWATRVQVQNGVVTAVSTTSGINVATSNSIGGIRLMNDTQTSVGEKVPVQLDLYGQAFIDKNYFDVDKHRDDLTKSDYHGDNIPKFINNIWQHIGPTTGDFVNGYFYKCTKTAFTVIYDTTNSPYSVGTLIGTKLENYIYDNGLTLDLNKPFRLYVDTYPTQRTEGQTIVDVKIADLDEFKLVNLDSQSRPIGTPLVMTQAQLSEVLDITLKVTDGWDTALTKDFPKSTLTLPFTLNSTNYDWKQWDVQPRTGIGSALEFITNDEIDYLFDVHVSSLSISDNELELSVGNTYTLEIEVNPADADNQMVTWSSSDPSAVSVVKTSPTEAEVTVGSDAVVGENYIITCTSVDSERTITCTITIVS